MVSMSEAGEIVAFLLAGALGGLVQAIIDKKGVIQAPRWDRAARQIDLGAIADLLIGSTGALAVLVLGVAALNALGARAVPTDAPATLFATLPRGLLLASFGTLVGFGSRRLLPALSDRISSAIEREVEARTAGLRQKIGEDVSQITQGQIDPLQDQQQVLISMLGDRSRFEGFAAAGETAPTTVPDPLAELERLVLSYEQIEHPDYATRVRRKDECYNEMGALILRHDISFDEILSRIGGGGGQGWILALAARLSVKPELDRGADLVRVAMKAQWKHVMYRVASTFAQLAGTQRLRAREIPAVESLFDGYLSAADDSLRRKIEATRKVIESRRSDLP